MRAKAQRWGNSLAIQIPKVIAEEADVRERDELELDRLLKDVRQENLHGELDFGKPKGRATW